MGRDVDEFRKDLLAEFQNPGSPYRGKPFWAWNGKMEPQELRRQIRIMKRMGLGGFFMHSRVGLATPYLSEEWHDCIRACVEEAGEQDMEAWLYDEDRWPSGAAGGMVTKNPRHRRRSLALEELRKAEDLVWEESALAAFVAVRRGDGIEKVRRIARDAATLRLGAGERILLFRVKIDACDSWYNGYTYLDTLNAKAVRRFLEATHEAYKKRFGGDFGKRIPGIFTDEPNYGHTLAGDRPSAIPWTDRLPAVFRKRYGYDILEHLPEIFYNVDGKPFTPARYHYHDCITHMFVDAFSRQIGEWCEANGIAHTGHVLAEATLHSQTDVAGSVMRFYEYMQAPGMDILTEHWREYDTAKQVSSAARQFGRKWRLTETYGCTGWDFPFLGHKAVGDWQLALGINLRCQHLAWYTMQGQAKRDFPASIFYQSPWWESYAKVEDYFARVHAVMVRGQEVRDLLVVHPVESAWVLCRKGWLDEEAQRAAVTAFSESLVEVRDGLLAANIDFDYADEEILARHGRLEEKGEHLRLSVGLASYKAVVVPPMKTVRSTTLDLMERFREAGGTVVFAGEPPHYVDAVPSDRAGELAADCLRAPVKGGRLAAAVNAPCRRISITNGKGAQIRPTLHLLREDRRACYLFVCNTGHDFSGTSSPAKRATDIPVRERKSSFDDIRIRGLGECRGKPVELDPDTGKACLASASYAEGAWEVRTSLPALGSRLFVFPKGPVSGFAAHSQRTVKGRIALGGRSWEYALSEANCLVLDRCRLRMGSGKRKAEEEILRVDRAVRDRLGLAHRGGRMVQPWAQKKKRSKAGVPIELAYRFNVEALPSGDLHLALEQPRRYRIRLNGAEIATDGECGWWVDRSLRKLPVDAALLRRGENELVMKCEYDEEHAGLECVYLLGSFAVWLRSEKGPTIDVLPNKLLTGSWVEQGLPFYSGSVSYIARIVPQFREEERLIVSVPEYRGAAVRILVNGASAGVIAWDPPEIDITDYLQNGRETDVRIQVLGHRRNSHGPLHHAEKWPEWTGSEQFVTSGKEWTDGYQLVPCGLTAAPRILVCG